MKLNNQQLLAIRYYEGDVENSKDPFWSDEKAYVTINSLFFDDIESEKRRADEGKKLNFEIIRDVPRLIDVCDNIFSCFCVADLSQYRITYRVERYMDFLEMKQRGGTISFTSTSSKGFLKSYGDRIGITLIEFHIPSNTPCFPFEEVLNENYQKKDEQEILLPPFLKINFEKIPLENSDLEIIDAHGKPPIEKYLATITGAIKDNPIVNETILYDSDSLLAAKRVFDALNHGLQPNNKDIKLYCNWKKQFQNLMLLKHQF